MCLVMQGAIYFCKKRPNYSHVVGYKLESLKTLPTKYEQ